MVKTLTRTSRRRAMAATMVWLQIYAPALIAEDQGLSWAGELYGGKYYNDNRLGVYFTSSKQLDRGATLIGEVLHENYTDYSFKGLGAHILWPAGAFGDVGLAVSQAWETYEIEPDIERDFQTRSLALEWEFEQGPITVAAQAGKFLKDYADNKHAYMSADMYFWGEQFDWYLRGAVRRVADESLHIVEGYRIFDPNGRNVTAYVGIITDDLDSVALGGEDAMYAGAYIELFSAERSMLTLWVEAAREQDDTLLTVELNLAFGPGARTPHITAFGFSLDD